ncbi:MAG: polyprenyl synthetase family protein [Gemmatimonadetes bacterium]|nr:polyprenyl synthetase family protein [Gemmatimonadota bacterium]
MSGVAVPDLDVAALLERRRAVVEAALARLLDELLRDAPPAVAQPARYAVAAGGKRLRPILCLAAHEAAGGTPADGVLDVACGIELIHTYSLVHDDLPCMDDDDLRRGQPTTHRRFGVAAAMVAGAALIPLACRAVLRGSERLGLEVSARAVLVRELCVAAGGGGMVGGQLLDLRAEGHAVALPVLESIHRAKTGALLAASARLGGLAAGAPAGVVAALSAYGEALGLAFQIADDVLDVTGESARLGKTAGRDVELGKATFPALLGVDGARRSADAEAARAIAALEAEGIATAELVALARYAARRDR